MERTHEATDLLLWANNTGEFWAEHIRPVIGELAAAEGSYTEKEAYHLWRVVACDAAKAYCAEHCDKNTHPSELFNIECRHEFAEAMLSRYDQDELKNFL